jgi:hypothetical protein
LVGAVVTLTDADADLVGSAVLVAVTVSVPAVEGAVYIPAAVILPSDAFHVTPLLEVVPCTVALNGSVPAVIEDAVTGDIATEVTVGEDAGAVGLALTWGEFALSPAEPTAEMA